MAILPFRSRQANKGDNLLLALVDLQAEYRARGRLYALNETDTCIANCARLLAAGRALRMPIAHFRQSRRGLHFNDSSGYSGWLHGLEPTGSEMLFERNLPSIYANLSFASLIGQIDNPIIILTGLTGACSCLATAIEAFHRDHRVIFVRDASATPALGDDDEVRSHSIVAAIIAQFAEVMDTQDMLAQLGSSRITPMQALLS